VPPRTFVRQVLTALARETDAFRPNTHGVRPHDPAAQVVAALAPSQSRSFPNQRRPPMTSAERDLRTTPNRSLDQRALTTTLVSRAPIRGCRLLCQVLPSHNHVDPRNQRSDSCQ